MVADCNRTKQIKILTNTLESENSVIAPGKHSKIK